MRWLCGLLVVAGCTYTSAWDRHKTQLGLYSNHGQYEAATVEAQWMITNAFKEAPKNELTMEAEARRYLRLAEFAAKSGDTRLAVSSLQAALNEDPNLAPDVRKQVDQLPVSPAELDRLKQQFAWNITAIDPEHEAYVEHPAPSDCWSYDANEIRIRQRQTLRTVNGMQRQVVYDTRSWTFDPTSGRWSVRGAWVLGAGTETELVDGPARPGFQAVLAADHGFYAAGTVPACHRAGWRGPYDSNGTGFVAPHLPGRKSSNKATADH